MCRNKKSIEKVIHAYTCGSTAHTMAPNKYVRRGKNEESEKVGVKQRDEGKRTAKQQVI